MYYWMGYALMWFWVEMGMGPWAENDCTFTASCSPVLY